MTRWENGAARIGAILALVCGALLGGCQPGSGPVSSIGCQVCVDQCAGNEQCSQAKCAAVCSGSQSYDDPCQPCLDECAGDEQCAAELCPDACITLRDCDSCVEGCAGDQACVTEKCGESCAKDCAVCKEGCAGDQACYDEKCAPRCG